MAGRVKRVQRSTERRRQLLAGSVAAVLAVGGAHVADRVVDVPTCGPVARFGPFGDGLVADRDVLAARLLDVANDADAVTGTEIRHSIAPAVVPGHRRLEAGQTGTWEVAVLQLPGAARTLQVDGGDDGDMPNLDIPPGSGACHFKVSRSFTKAADGRVLRFTAVDPPLGTGPAPDAVPGVQVIVDVVGRA